MSNVLSFVLGMESTGFGRAIDGARSKVSSFIGTAAKVTGLTVAATAAESAFRRMGDAFHGIGDAFQRGANLQQLRNRTGQSVSDLFLLQRGFANVGLESESVGEMIFHLQRSLTGISEVGEDTSVVFSLLGLNMANLRREGASKAIQDIAGAFERLDPSQAAGFASKLFGRGQASNFLQLARDSQTFTKALHDNAGAAAQMGQNASGFQRLEISLQTLKFKAQDMFTGIAAGIAPAIERITDMLQKIDLSGLGKDLGAIFGGFAGALEGGHLGEAIGETLKAGFEMAVAMAPAIFAKLGVILLKVFQTPIEYLSAGMEYAVERLGYEMTNGKMMKLMTALPGGKIYAASLQGMASMFGIGSTQAPDMATIMARQKSQGLRFNVGTGEFGLSDMEKSANDAWAKDAGKAGGIWGGLVKSMAQFQSALGPLQGAGKSGALPTGNYFGAVDKKSFEATNFEKIGIHLAGGAGPSLIWDHARQTAVNTAKMVTHLVNIEKLLRSEGYVPQRNANA